MEIAYSILCTFYLLQNDCRQKSQNRPTAGKPPICHPFQDMKGNFPAKHGRIGHCDRSIEAGWVEKLLGIHRSLKQICRHTPLVAFNASPQQATEAYREAKISPCLPPRKELLHGNLPEILAFHLILATHHRIQRIFIRPQGGSTHGFHQTKASLPQPQLPVSRHLRVPRPRDPVPMAVVRNTSATHCKS